MEIRFVRALTTEEQHRSDQELRIWAALVHGGYLEPGELPGSSTIASISVRFDAPHTLRLHTDAVLAGVACLEPLMALVVGWSATIPVASVVAS